MARFSGQSIFLLSENVIPGGLTLSSNRTLVMRNCT
jgi:hypothetical protein